MADAGSGGPSPARPAHPTATPPAATGPAAAGPPASARSARRDRSAWNWLLLLPLVAVLYPPLYNRSDPWLFGLPFFYWYQLVVILLSVVCTLLVYRAGRGTGASR